MTRRPALTVLRDACVWSHLFTGRRVFAAAAAALCVYLAESPQPKRAGVIVLADRRGGRRRG
jgi:hypothetical protein